MKAFSQVKPRDESIKYITDFGFPSKTNPILAVSTATILFSNAGIPPSAGSYGKLNVSLSAMSGSMYLLAIVGVLRATMGAFYSIRLVKIIHHHPSRPHWESPKQMSKESAIILAFTFPSTLLSFMYPSFLFVITHPAASTPSPQPPYTAKPFSTIHKINMTLIFPNSPVRFLGVPSSSPDISFYYIYICTK